jgi:hypothetical protein
MSYRPLVLLSHVSSASKNGVMYRTIRIAKLPSYEVAHEIIKKMYTLHDVKQTNDIVPIDYRIVASHCLPAQSTKTNPFRVRGVHLWLTFGNELTMLRFIQCMPNYQMYVPHLHYNANSSGHYHVGITHAYEHKNGEAFITRRQRLIDVVQHSLPSFTHSHHNHTRNHQNNSDGMMYTPITIKCARCVDCQQGTLIELITSYYSIQA